MTILRCLWVGLAICVLIPILHLIRKEIVAYKARRQKAHEDACHELTHELTLEIRTVSNHLRWKRDKIHKARDAKDKAMIAILSEEIWDNNACVEGIFLLRKAKNTFACMLKVKHPNDKRIQMCKLLTDACCELKLILRDLSPVMQNISIDNMKVEDLSKTLKR